MLIKKPDQIPEREVTEKRLYLNRRQFVRAAVLAGSTAATAGLYRTLNPPPSPQVAQAKLTGIVRASPADAARHGYSTDEKQTPLTDITHYNNFYEFSTEKDGVADEARGFVARPWTVSVEGLVAKPKVFDLDDLLKISPPEERIYRMRCVEGWSMVIPWVGLPLAKVLERVEPTSQAKFVAFQTLHDPSRMPNQHSAILTWPYVEGLRMDEAMHPLTILASGLYGEALPQNGAPLRLVVPWKYGFKGIKSIVRIRLVETQPPTTWNIAGPDEYGFYSNVNPDVDHPRWSQASERRIGEFGRRPTLPFNGYGEQVAHLYAGMDLRKDF